MPQRRNDEDDDDDDDGDDEIPGAGLGKTTPGAYIGGSNTYSNESFEDRFGEGLHVNSSWTWVSRP